MIERTAACACGQLRVTCVGEPERVSLCTCTECQRRTGSAYGVAAYFRRERIKAVEGQSAGFTRISDAGRWLTFRFCPECGTTVYWEAELLTETVGIALGTFADPSFAKPEAVVWAEHKADWVPLPEGIPLYPRNRPVP